MVKVVVVGDELVVQLEGWERFWSLRREIRIPLADIERLRPAPDLIGSRPEGIRAPGTHWPFGPGPAFAGSFFRGQGVWEFWSLIRARPEQILEVTVRAGATGSKYRRLVVQVEDSTRTIDEVGLRR